MTTTTVNDKAQLLDNLRAVFRQYDILFEEDSLEIFAGHMVKSLTAAYGPVHVTLTAQMVMSMYLVFIAGMELGKDPDMQIIYMPSGETKKH